MGTLNLFYKNWQGALWTWTLSDINAWSNEVPISGQPTDLTAAAPIPGSATLELFYADAATGQIATLASQAGGPYASLPPLAAAVNGNITTALVPGTQILQIFYRDSAGDVMTWWRQKDGPWSGPQKVASGAGSDITAIQVPGSRILHLFYRSTSGGVEATWRGSAGGWSSAPLGGTPTSKVSACRVPGSNALNIFYRGPNGAVITRQRTAGGSWTGEQSLGGDADGDITAVVLPTPNEDYLELFYRGANGEVKTMWRDPHTGNFTPESGLGGQVISEGAITAARIPGTPTLGLFYRGANSALMSNFRPENGAWTGEKDQGSQLESDITAAPTPQPLVPLPPNGLASNSNYFLYSDTPIIEFNATVEVTDDIVSDLGFAFQVNCWSPAQKSCAWQQYVLAVNANELQWHVENWNFDMSVNIVDWNQPWFTVPLTNTIQAGWRLMISLTNDAQGNVSQARFLVVDNLGTVQGNVLKDLVRDLHSLNHGVVAPVTQADLAPTVAVQVTLVGPGTTNTGPLRFGSTRLAGGAGSITFASATPMTVKDVIPPGTTGFNGPAPGQSVATGESANSSYGQLPAGPDYSFTQSFTATVPPEQVVCLDSAGHVHEFATTDGIHWAQADLHAIAGGPAAAPGSSVRGCQWPQKLAKLVVYLDGSGHVNELTTDPVHKWSVGNLTNVTGGPAAAPGSSLTTYTWAAGDSKQVVYLDAAGHAHHLSYVNKAPSWIHVDLTAITGGTPARPGSALSGYDWPAGSSQQVVYFDGAGHVNELWLVAGANWGHANLTNITGGPPAAAGSSLSGYAWALGSSKQVAYLDGAGHVQELVIGAGGHWTHADLTALTGAPSAAAGSALVGYEWSAGNSKQVAYLDGAGHVHELWIVHGGHWAHADLTSLAGAPPAASGSALSGNGWTAGRSKQVMYLDAGHHVHQLRIASGGAWGHTDLTAGSGAPAMVAGSPLSSYQWLTD